MKLPNRSVSRLIEMIRSWPDLKRMLYDYLGKVVIESREDGGPTGDIAPDTDTDLYYLNDPLPMDLWEQVAGATQAISGAMTVWQFADAADQRIRVMWTPPEGFDPAVNTVVLRLYHAAAATVGTKDVYVQIQHDAMVEGDTITSPGLTSTNQVVTCGFVDVLCVDDIVLTTGLGTLVEREPLILQVGRIGTAPSDTLTAIWELYHVVVRYRNDSLGRYP